MPGGQDGDLPLGDQVHGLQAREAVHGAVHDRHVGPAVAQELLLLADLAQQRLDQDRTRSGPVGVEESLQQLVEGAGFK
jgi:hypothetical protein